ncbi:MAG: branched-chain amino acid ABC transporter permease [Deltaproteobacteria bacterium]|nr:branched-chain amino acid ABC transporter permease [Deltaproteobacteria bacterium]
MLELIINAIVAGILLGGFYAAITLGLSVSFGMLDVVNIAHPGFIILGGYGVYLLNEFWGLDPILAGLVFAPLFFVIGIGVYLAYYHSFEKRGAESLRGLVFFFGILFLIEVGLLLTFGVDYRLARASWIGGSLNIGFLGISTRLAVPFLVGVIMTVLLYLFFSKTFLGMITRGVAQNSTAVRLMGANPVRIKTIAFGLSIATASIAGALMISIGPVEPGLGREFIGRVFAVTVLAGMGSIGGTLIAALLLGVAESLTATLGGPAWGMAVSFGILLLVLAIKPSGLFRR